VEHIVLILQMSVGPAIMISGGGLLLLVMTNRFGRIVDRSRLLAEELRDAAATDTRRVRRELAILIRRARLQRLAIAFTSVSVLLAAGLVIVMFLAGVGAEDASRPIVAMFSLCMGCLIIGLVYFIVDVNASLAALKIELDVAAHGSRDERSND